ncbi:MAG: type II secretion system protein [Patescibacteria group bacterium]
MFAKFHERRQRGFTLVELIIVLAIIAILSALAISRISYNRTRAANTTCNGIMGDIKKAAEAYYADLGDRPAGLVNSDTIPLIASDYMAGVPKQPHGASNVVRNNGFYNIVFPNTEETAAVDCPANNAVQFPDGAH